MNIIKIKGGGGGGGDMSPYSPPWISPCDVCDLVLESDDVFYVEEGEWGIRA